MAKLNRLVDWWSQVLLPWRRWRVVLSVPAGDEVPESLPHHGAVLVETSGSPTWLAFDCPCGSGHRIMLNLSHDRWPRWTLKSRSPLTVEPSIDAVNSGRRCHYFLKRGTVHWARELRKKGRR
jgi:uncharacterized protein DUF6527